MKDHLSYSQISTYLMCPLKYRFQYIDGLEWPFVPAALPFGSSIHRALAYFYEMRQQNGPCTVSDLDDIFSQSWKSATENKSLSFNRNESIESLDETGRKMLQVFHETVQPMRVIAVEEKFQVEPFDPATGEVLGMPFYGAIDLIEEDRDGTIVVVDHKTAARRYSDLQVSQNLQLSIYTLAVKQRGLTNGNEVLTRLDVLLKNKHPDLVTYHTVRSDNDLSRLFKLTSQVKTAIETDVFYPNPGYQCSGCPFQDACSKW